jgi:ubiquinone/menaquinone biosynthesis C-methylase UbiE
MSSLPSYDGYQTAFHEAFRRELYRALDALPLRADSRVLDVPCGDGFYSRHLAERLADGELHAVDASESYLTLAREALAGADTSAAIKVMRADAYHLPYPDASFDLVWCAQSLISLDVLPAVREMRRVVRPDGFAAILEVDEFHHVLLPWPVELEVVLPQAVHAASLKRYGDGAKLAPARRLRSVLQKCEFRSVRRHTHLAERAAPFDAETANFLAHHCAFLREFVYPHLPERVRPLFDSMTDPDGPDSLFRAPDAEFVCLSATYLARPQAEPGSARKLKMPSVMT